MTDDGSHLRTRPSLLARLRDRADAAAWELFVTTYTPLVYRHCRRRGLQEADAADIAQEAMAQVARSITAFDYDPARGRFRDWLGAVVHSKLVRLFRRQARAGIDLSDSELDGHPAPPADPAWAADFQAHVADVALARVRGEFAPQHWRAFEQTWCDQRPAADVAAELGLSITAVYIAKSRVLKRLREEVTALADDLPPLTPLALRNAPE